MEYKLINVGQDFSRYPAGRYTNDGPYSGEAFRDRFLIPALSDINQKLVIELDDARGLGSSFLEEAFGGLVRAGFSADDLFKRIELRANDKSLVEEIHTYIKDQSEAGTAS